MTITFFRYSLQKFTSLKKTQLQLAALLSCIFKFTNLISDLYSVARLGYSSLVCSESAFRFIVVLFQLSLFSTISGKDINLVLSICGNIEPIPVYEEDSPYKEDPPIWPYFDDLLQAIRDAPTKQWAYITGAFELVEIQESVRTVLKAIKSNLDDLKNYKGWNPSVYDKRVLCEPGTDLYQPDAFFSYYTNTTARLILRLASKEILFRIRCLGHLLQQ